MCNRYNRDSLPPVGKYPFTEQTALPYFYTPQSRNAEDERAIIKKLTD